MALSESSSVIVSRRPADGRRRTRRRPQIPGVLVAHPAIAVLPVITVWFLVLAVTMIGSGLLVTHLVAHGRIGHWDEHVNSWFAHHRAHTWNSVSADFTLLANTLGVVVVAAVTTVVLLIRRWGRFALLLVIGLAIELAVFLSTTYLVGRPRPDVERLGSTPSTFSWPSGHVAATLVLYCGIALLVTRATHWRVPRIAAWVIAVALTVSVALSRVYRGEHHPTDAIAGAVLGVGALWAAVLVIRAWGSPATRRVVNESPPIDAAEPVVATAGVQP
jgi:membrane-associated phospholipid phosphatase